MNILCYITSNKGKLGPECPWISWVGDKQERKWLSVVADMDVDKVREHDRKDAGGRVTQERLPRSNSFTDTLNALNF